MTAIPHDRRKEAKMDRQLDQQLLVSLVDAIGKPWGTDEDKWRALMGLLPQISRVCFGYPGQATLDCVLARRDYHELCQWMIHLVSRQILMVAETEAEATTDAELNQWIHLWRSVYYGACDLENPQFLQPVVKQAMALDIEIASRLQLVVDMHWENELDLYDELDRLLFQIALRMPLKTICFRSLNDPARAV